MMSLALRSFPVRSLAAVASLVAVAFGVARPGTACPTIDDPKRTGWVEESKEEPDGTHYHTFRSEAVDGEVSYLIYFPPGYDDDKDRRYPVLYWLHGMTHTQREGGGLVRRLDRAIRAGRAPEMIVVLVNGRTHSYFCDSPDGRTPVESMIVKDLVPHIDKTYRTRDRSSSRAVEGYSMGGFGAAHLGFKYPETFGVVSVLAGALNRYEDFAERNSKTFRAAFGADKEYFEENEPWRLAKKNRDAIRDGLHVRIVVGDKDPVYDGNKAFHEHLKELEIEHEFLVVDGVTHDYEKLLDGLDDNALEIYRKQWGRAKDKAR